MSNKTPTSQSEKSEKPTSPLQEVGFLTQIQDYLFYVEGLPSARINDLIVSEKGSRALVTGLSKDRVEAMLLDRERPKPGEMFKIGEHGLQLSIDDRLLGRSINPLGEALDGKAPVSKGTTGVELDVIAHGIDARKVINEQLNTGITVIDTLVPIGKGQRELIFGEPRAGKTSFLLHLIVNQKGKDIVCIYNAVGRDEIDIKRFVKALEENGALDYSVVVAASSSEAAPIVSISPDVALSVAEYFRDKGKDVLIIIDDLGRHAKYVREIALISNRIPGRESYPGDIFYQHAHNLERAGSYNEKAGGGTITFLPVIETDMERFTALIPTNVMASTDGHLLFSAALRAEGHYPAVNSSVSVTRVGAQTQKLTQKIVSDHIKMLLAQYEELRRFSRFGADVSEETQQTIKRGLIAHEMIKQEPLTRIEPIDQIVFLSLVFTKFFDDKNLDFFLKNKDKILTTVQKDPQCVNVKKQINDKIDTMKFDELMSTIEPLLPVFEKVCQQSPNSQKS